MSDPRRLLDDPDAPAALREALAAEAHRTDLYDPSALAARVAQGIAAAAPAASTATAGSALLFGPKVLVVTALLSAAVGAGSHAVYRARADTPALPVATAAAWRPAPTLQALPEAQPSAPAPALAPAPASVAPVPPPPAPASAARAPAAVRPGALADELRLYERGEAALLEGRLDVAVRELKRYLAEHPRGTLRAEAELALVQALARSGRCDEALARAARARSAAQRGALDAAAASCTRRP